MPGTNKLTQCWEIIQRHVKLKNKNMDRFHKEHLRISNLLSVFSSLSVAVDPPPLFSNLMPSCKPIATKSRRLSQSDWGFIESKITKYISVEGPAPHNSQWEPLRNCSLIIVIGLDTYPLPRVDDLAIKLSKCKIFSTLDLKSAHHQIPTIEYRPCTVPLSKPVVDCISLVGYLWGLQIA